MPDKVMQRREAKVAAIVAAAWRLARDHGIAGVSLHALAREVGMRQPSLYVYFDSKHALYDAMFADGNRQLLERVEQLGPAGESDDAAASLAEFVTEMVRFSTEDPTRHGLMFQHSIPGFEPSPGSYALAERFY